MKINLVKISFIINVILLQNRSILSKNSNDPIVFLTDAQFQELKNTSENTILWLLIQQNTKLNEENNSLKKEIQTKNNTESILENIKKLKEIKNRVYTYSKEYAEIGKKILGLYQEIN